VLLEQGHLAEALAECRKAVELDCKSAGPLIALGDVQYRQGSYVPAIQSYRSASVLDPTSLAAWDGAGKAYLWAGDFASAAQTYQPGHAVDGDSRRLHLGRADVSLARNSADRSVANEGVGTETLDLREAESQYTLCASEGAELALVAHVRLAVIETWKGNIDASRVHAEAAARAFQLAWERRTHADPDLYEFYAVAALLQGDVDSALSRLEEASRIYAFEWRFDSQRVGVYELLRDRGVEGFDRYAMAAGWASLSGTPA
jgi:tetratricopeptide (TPR) repeat protein